MTLTVVLAVVLIAAAAVVALVLERRKADPPTQPRSYPTPRQLDRSDFARPEAPWLVVLFASDTCDTCERMAAKVRVLESREVAVDEAEFTARPDLHERYGITGVPMVLVADHEGVVLRAFVGSASATDLWAAVAEVRDPGSAPEPGLGALDDRP
jgi:thioredoxin-related protein